MMMNENIDCHFEEGGATRCGAVGCGASCCLLYYNIAGEAWLVSIIDVQRPKRYL
jgi:hypothetical protein